MYYYTHIVGDKGGFYYTEKIENVLIEPRSCSRSY